MAYPTNINNISPPDIKIVFLFPAVMLGFLALISISFMGCATMHLPEYPHYPASSYNNAKINNELCIATYAMTSKKELIKYFGTDLLAVKILPVNIIIENRSLSSSFLFSTDQVSLHNNSIQISKKQISQDKVLNSSDDISPLILAPVAFAVPLLGGVLLPLSIGKSISDTSIIELNLVSKELFASTVSPGNMIDGFVYFMIPEDIDKLGELILSIKIRKLVIGTSHNYEFTLQ